MRENQPSTSRQKSLTVILLTAAAILSFLISCTSTPKESVGALLPLPNLMYLPAERATPLRFRLIENSETYEFTRTFTERGEDLIITDTYAPPRNGLEKIVYKTDTGGNVEEASGYFDKTENPLSLRVAHHGDRCFSVFLFQMDTDDQTVQTMVKLYGELTNNGFRFKKKGSRNRGIVIGSINDSQPPIYRLLFIDDTLPQEARIEVWRTAEKEIYRIEAVF